MFPKSIQNLFGNTTELYTYSCVKQNSYKIILQGLLVDTASE